MKKQPKTPTDDGLRLIDAWQRAHLQHLQDVGSDGDTKARGIAQITAAAEKMRAEYLARKP